MVAPVQADSGQPGPPARALQQEPEEPAVEREVAGGRDDGQWPETGPGHGGDC